jgi:hypothetical protein
MSVTIGHLCLGSPVSKVTGAINSTVGSQVREYILQNDLVKYDGCTGNQRIGIA